MTIETFSPRSTNIANVTYDTESKDMTVEFMNGSTYSYGDVPMSLYQGFATASSAGRYFHSVIKDAYPGTEV